MSYCANVKTDLLKVNNLSIEQDKAEIEALLRMGSEIVLSNTGNTIAFYSNNMGVIRRLITLLLKYYKLDYEILSRVVSRFNSKTSYSLVIKSNIEQLINDYSLLQDESKNKELYLESNSLKEAYLRGAFLVHGSVNDPTTKNSHLEISSTSEHEIIFLQKIMNSFELNGRIIKRKNYLVLYIKATEAIADFLYRIGASLSMEYYENAIITKEMSAKVKREINLEVANQNKTNQASLEQLKYIHYLKMNYPLEKLDTKLLMVMKVREENRESSLSELLEIIHNKYDPNLTKSGLNHRFRKLKEIAILHQNNRG